MGLGTQDDLDYALDFVASTGTSTFPMYWEDGGFDGWAFYGVRSQPAGVLVDADGNVIESWSGRFSLDTVLELASGI
ncbi:MAG: hypothetical protein R2733_02725 [Acidimicrobiales bacterium]